MISRTALFTACLITMQSFSVFASDKRVCELMTGPDRSETLALILDKNDQESVVIRSDKDIDEIIKLRNQMVSGEACKKPSKSKLGSCDILPGPDNSGNFGLVIQSKTFIVTDDLNRLRKLRDKLIDADVCTAPQKKDRPVCRILSGPAASQTFGLIADYGTAGGDPNLIKTTQDIDSLVRLRDQAADASFCTLPKEKDLPVCKIMPGLDGNSGLVMENLIVESNDSKKLEKKMKSLMKAGVCIDQDTYNVDNKNRDSGRGSGSGNTAS